MSCNQFEDCYKNEAEQMQYPVDSESLYANRYYDDQTAKSRCYAKKPVDIIEGFGMSLTWTNVIKLVVVILLIYLAYSLSKDFLCPKKIIMIGVETPSMFSVGEPSIMRK